MYKDCENYVIKVLQMDPNDPHVITMNRRTRLLVYIDGMPQDILEQILIQSYITLPMTHKLKYINLYVIYDEKKICKEGCFEKSSPAKHAEKSQNHSLACVRG